jgi:nucleoside-diphosphate-sugar epimerase
MDTWYVIGAGYTGSRLVDRLAREGRDEVLLTRRRKEDAEAMSLPYGSLLVGGIELDLARPETVQGDFGDAFVVCLAPPGPEPAREIQTLVDACRDAKRFIYVSSTGVYGPGHGALVDETWPIAPLTASGRARAAAEAALPPSAIILRAAGIYGPGRGLVDRIRAGTYRIIGDGSAHVSRIHVDDLVEAIIRAAASNLVGPVNCADDDPAPIGDVADTLAAQLGKPLPPRVDPSTVDPEIAGMLTANRRISNARMKNELGVVLRYPSWRDSM